MNWTQIEGKWQHMTVKAKEQWTKLTDEDLKSVAGKEDQLIGKVQERYGVQKDEAKKQVAAWSEKLS